MQLLTRLVQLAVGAAACLVATGAAAPAKCFPDEFLFGSATAAYQVEGAAAEGGRTPSVWDDYCRTQPGVMCANVADDFYHRYKADIQLMKENGLQSFRFSISWSRAMTWDPATRRMKANPEGIAFYHDMIDELNRNNIAPILTLYHYDLPLALQDELAPKGWLNKDIVGHFTEYSTLMFQEFGHKVDFWSTFNEPQGLAGYYYGLKGFGPPAEDPTPTSAYMASYTILVSHARAVEQFRRLKASGVVRPTARIAIVQVAQYYYPLDTANSKDVAAAERVMNMELGWFLIPTLTGDWPPALKQRGGDRVPQFTAEESKVLKGSYDLFMLNHYFSRAVTDCDSPTSNTPCEALPLGWANDKGVDDSHLMPGSMPGKLDSYGREYCKMFTGYPPGYLDVIKWVHAKDPTVDILLTENGWCGDGEVENMDQLNYFKAFVNQVYLAVADKIPVIGYTAWSFVDNYEWGSFGPRFGLYYVNFTSQAGSPDFYEPKPTDLERIPRPAAKWFKQVATTRCLDDPAAIAVAATAAEPEEIATLWSVWGFAVVGAVVLVAVAAVVVVVVQRRRRDGYEGIPLISGN